MLVLSVSSPFRSKMDGGGGGGDFFSLHAYGALITCNPMGTIDLT